MGRWSMPMAGFVMALQCVACMLVLSSTYEHQRLDKLLQLDVLLLRKRSCRTDDAEISAKAQERNVTRKWSNAVVIDSESDGNVTRDFQRQKVAGDEDSPSAFEGSSNGGNSDDDSDSDSVDGKADANVNNTLSVVQMPGNETRRLQCDSIFTSLSFWGANIVIFANVIYIIPYLIVVLVYFAVPGSRIRAYNRAVISYNVSQIALNGILIGIGSSVLCHVSIDNNLYAPLGLTIMFLTVSSTLWLVVLCFDMTLAITRFRWAPPSDASREEEKRKFRIYAACAWSGALLPTAFACVVEMSPFLSENSPLRPKFHRFKEGANLAVILYVISLPALACLTNTILFFYTTYRMILIQRSTALASASSTASTDKTIRSRYFLFLRLYLLMDAPWLTSGLAAAFTDLWILKFFRMIQPFLMLLAILPPHILTSTFRCSFAKPKSMRFLPCFRCESREANRRRS